MEAVCVEAESGGKVADVGCGEKDSAADVVAHGRGRLTGVEVSMEWRRRKRGEGGFFG